MAAGLPAEPHVPLARYHLLYLGRAAPADVPDGLEAIQKPLIELLHQANVQGPLDATLTVYTNGILAESSAGSDKWWPIQDLMECGAFKQSADGPLPFVPLMSLDGAAKSAPSSPTLFAMTFRRQDIPAANTWVFIAPSDDSAFTLVQAITAAHENTAGWSSPNDRPPVAANVPSVQLSHTSNSSSQGYVSQYAPRGNSVFHAQSSARNGGDSSWDDGFVRKSVRTPDRRNFSDYYQKPPLRGYFYAPNSSLIQKYCVSDNQQKPVPPQPAQPAPQPQQPQIQVQPVAPQILSPMPIYDPFALTTANVECNGHKKHHKKKKKKTRNHFDDSSDDDDDEGAVELFTNRNGQKVVVVPEEIAVVRPNRYSPRQEPAGLPPLPPDAVPVWIGPDGSVLPADPADVGAGPIPFRDGYITPGGTHYESRILPGPGQPLQPVVAQDPFADEGPYERRLPVGGFPGDFGPLPAGTVFEDPAAAMYSPNFILRPNDGFRLPA